MSFLIFSRPQDGIMLCTGPRHPRPPKAPLISGQHRTHTHVPNKRSVYNTHTHTHTYLISGESRHIHIYLISAQYNITHTHVHISMSVYSQLYCIGPGSRKSFMCVLYRSWVQKELVLQNYRSDSFHVSCNGRPTQMHIEMNTRQSYFSYIQRKTHTLFPFP